MTGLFRGVYPILLTVFDEREAWDESCQRKAIDFLLDAGVHGLVTLANASEGYAVSDAERDRIVDVVIDQVRGRVPVIVGVSHPSAKIAAERSRAAGRAGASGILSLPPFYGSWVADTAGVYNYFGSLSATVDLPVIVQDHPLTGMTLPPALLARMALELENVRYFKIEVPRSPTKIAETISLGGDRILGIFGGMGGMTFLEELDRGACGTMPSSALPEAFVRVYEAFVSGNRAQSQELLNRYLPLIKFELHLAGKNMQKELLKMGGIICSAAAREPVPPSFDETTRQQMLELIRQFDLFALKYISSKETVS
jgi:2-keto-3-deoxy-L-arabinonate dehydratase